MDLPLAINPCKMKGDVGALLEFKDRQVRRLHERVSQMEKTADLLQATLPQLLNSSGGHHNPYFNWILQSEQSHDNSNCLAQQKLERNSQVVVQVNFGSCANREKSQGSGSLHDLSSFLNKEKIDCFSLLTMKCKQLEKRCQELEEQTRKYLQDQEKYRELEKKCEKLIEQQKKLVIDHQAVADLEKYCLDVASQQTKIRKDLQKFSTIYQGHQNVKLLNCSNVDIDSLIKKCKGMPNPSEEKFISLQILFHTLDYRCTELESSNGNLSSKMEMVTLRCNNLEKLLDFWVKERSKIQKICLSYESILNKKDEDVVNKTQQIEDIQKTLQNLKDAFERETIEKEQITALKAELYKLNTQVEKDSLTISDVLKEKDMLLKDKAKLLEDKGESLVIQDQLRTEISTYSEKYNNLQEEYNLMQYQVQELETKLTEQETRNKKQSEEIENLQELCRKLKLQINNKKPVQELWRESLSVLPSDTDSDARMMSLMESSENDVSQELCVSATDEEEDTSKISIQTSEDDTNELFTSCETIARESCNQLRERLSSGDLKMKISRLGKHKSMQTRQQKGWCSISRDLLYAHQRSTSAVFTICGNVFQSTTSKECSLSSFRARPHILTTASFANVLNLKRKISSLKNMNKASKLSFRNIHSEFVKNLRQQKAMQNLLTQANDDVRHLQTKVNKLTEENNELNKRLKEFLNHQERGDSIPDNTSVVHTEKELALQAILSPSQVISNQKREMAHLRNALLMKDAVIKDLQSRICKGEARHKNRVQLLEGYKTRLQELQTKLATVSKGKDMAVADLKQQREAYTAQKSISAHLKEQVLKLTAEKEHMAKQNHSLTKKLGAKSSHAGQTTVESSNKFANKKFVEELHNLYNKQLIAKNKEVAEADYCTAEFVKSIDVYLSLLSDYASVETPEPASKQDKIKAIQNSDKLSAEYINIITSSYSSKLSKWKQEFERLCGLKNFSKRLGKFLFYLAKEHLTPDGKSTAKAIEHLMC